MDSRDNENKLVPGQGQPLRLDQLKKLAAGQGVSAPAATPMKRARFRRAGKTWTGVLAIGAVLSAAGALMLRKGDLLDSLVRLPAAPAAPDHGMASAEQEKMWALAAFEPNDFPGLLGVRKDDAARMEVNARKLQRLLSEETGLQ
jgi:hypothetical protein